MGMFDSFYIELDGREQELQSKRFDCGLNNYRLGDWVAGSLPGVCVITAFESCEDRHELFPRLQPAWQAKRWWFCQYRSRDPSITPSTLDLAHLTMRVVLDTNTLVSGVISANGPPRRLLNAARKQAFKWYASPALLEELLEELLDVLSRDKFAQRLSQADLSAQGIVSDLQRIAHLVVPTHVPRVIENDADDDHVIACAKAAQAELIVSGDKHLHSLGGYYQAIRIATPAEAIAIIETVCGSFLAS
jgi:putative PIN family toxin of toxin-antitoxin system